MEEGHTEITDCKEIFKVTEINKNSENPFVLVETASLMLWPHAFPCVQAPRQKPAAIPSIPTG